jgi:DNA-binding winged helix-turn-helix (wHTH) protein/Tol biopolymer transport system component
MQKQAVADIHQEKDFGLGEVIVSPSHNTLSTHDRTVNLQPKAMAVLCYLAKNQDRVISNQELIERLWEGRIVTHGSVQKSINSIRSAFAELAVDQDVIAHYSKRGYQLKVEPAFQNEPQKDPKTAVTTYLRNSGATPQKSRHFVIVAVTTGLMLIAGYYLLNNPIPKVNKQHSVSFQSVQGYTNETGHERNAEPHPDNSHIAYVREHFNLKHQGETKSEIMIRDASGSDWRVAETNGSWFKLAWSPEGKHLVAVEVIQIEGMPLTPNFYEKPNYLYSFHIFSLDLAGKRLLEKQLLSQWQGRIFSVSWWDETTLEFVAKQGTDSTNERYRYSIQDQTLNMLDEVEGVVNPIGSVVHNKITALVSLHKTSVQVSFLREDQSLISRHNLDYSYVDISWIPDGSGVLIYSGANRELSVLYMDGQQVDIPIADTRDKVFSRPRYASDGKSILYTEEKRGSNIFLLQVDGSKLALTQNNNLNYSASFSPDGKKVVYASVRSNQIHLWLVEAGQEKQLTQQPMSKKIGSIVWSDDAKYLIFNSGVNVYRYDFVSSQTSLLWSDRENVEPLVYLLDKQQLFLLKQNGEIKNLWRIDLTSQQQKQLTFGSVGSVTANDKGIFFQYTDEAGLWLLDTRTEALKLVTAKLSAHNKLLKADANSGGIYFISGGICRESDIYHLDFASETTSTFLKRDQSRVMTTSFSPDAGVLHTECYLAEANIVQMK